MIIFKLILILIWGIGMSFVLLRNKYLPANNLIRLFFGWMALGSIYTLLLVCWYFIFGQINGWVCWFLLLVTSSVALLPKDNHKIDLDYRKIKIPLWTWLVLVADIIILVLFILVRTDQPVISPWNLLGSEVFVLYATATFFLFLLAQEAKTWLFLSLSTLHSFVTLSAAAIIYAVGFGFDPFVHRAAEQAMLEQGFIQPQQILYSGQYLLVTALHHITSIPLKQIDIWLVPLISSLAFPISSYLGLRYGWLVKQRLAQIGSLSFLFLPMVLSYFTVPFTATHSFFICLMFLLPLVKDKIIALVIFLLALTMIFFHPLLAVPCTILILGYFFGQKYKMLFKVVSMLAIILVVPAMFLINAEAGLQGLIIHNPLSRLDLFINLFRNPFIDHFPYIPVYLDLLYDIRFYWPYCLLLLSGLAYVSLVKQRRVLSWYFVFALGLLGAIFLSSTMFEIPGIIVHEQAEFALRLEQALFTSVIPLVVLLMIKTFVRVSVWLRRAFIILLVGIITINWFFTYPQYNLKYPFFSPSVSQSDVKTVQEIDFLAGEQDYLVLSNQMTSAAALQEFGFANYYQLDDQEILWYAIPTGGQLYQEFIGMIEFGQIEQRMKELQQKAGVDQIYLVLHSYWPWSEQFISELFQTASGYLEIDNQIQIYIYNFEYNEDL